MLERERPDEEAEVPRPLGRGAEPRDRAVSPWPLAAGDYWFGGESGDDPGGSGAARGASTPR
ncbi:hypothetical protein [Streptomyces sp. NRRL F-2580]|uniref:hypothetical protein n=1 Tax=Streptomyces sp. NRRL F-2580 TaxID=1463841 RepID=UPI0004C6140C|nr:hypothetical protein [Streptomyces sp. NRRL F-2580]